MPPLYAMCPVYAMASGWIFQYYSAILSCYDLATPDVREGLHGKEKNDMPDTLFGTVTVEGSMEALSDLISAGLGASAKIGLYLSTFNPSRNNVFADFVAAEASFTGYVREVITFAAPGVDAAGNVRSISDNVVFTCTDAVTPEVIGGAFVTQEVAGPPIVNLSFAFYPFATPIPIQAPDQQIALKVVVTAPDLSGYAVLE
jgi:hypothetical protein